MSGEEHYLRAIDHLADVQRNSETQTEELIRAIGKLVVAVAANEATYEIEAASSVAETSSLAETTDAINSTRETLSATIEDAITVSKYGFHAKHQENVLRSELIGELPTDPTD